jgi:hypothetical protein
LTIEEIQANSKPTPENISSNGHGENDKVHKYGKEVLDDSDTVELLILEMIMGVGTIRPGCGAKDVTHGNVS